MITEDRPPESLAEHWTRLAPPRVLVIGDVMLDRFTYGPIDRISQEAPVMVLSAEETESHLGGAANVAMLLRTLQAQVTLAGVVGDDEPARVLRSIASASQIRDLIAPDPSRPTTVKQRYIGRAAHRHSSQILRVDHEAAHDLDESVAGRWLPEWLDQLPEHDVVVLSDYAKGACTATVVRAVIEAARRHRIPVLVDPGRGRCLDFYRGSTLIKPNRFEAEALLGMPAAQWKRTDRWLAPTTDGWPCDHLLVTLDAEGMLLCTPGERPRHLKARRRAVYDITGAGDAVIATVAFAWGGGLSPRQAAWLGNLAGGIAVEKPGVTPVSHSEMAHELRHMTGRFCPKILPLAEVAAVCRDHQRRGERIVLTNGCFDLLHYGHVQYLQQAREQGDRLVVAINGDASVRKLKGPTRPVIEQSQRAAMLAALSCVDYVVVFDEPTPHRVLEAVRPDLLVKGGTYRIDEVVGREVVEGYGGQVAVLGLVEGLSTTRIVEKIRRPDPARRAG